jgi:hypothetical protein
MHPIVVLGDKAQVEAHFGPLEIVLILTQDRCMFCANLPWAHKYVWTQPMELLCDVGHVKSCFGLFEDSVSVGAR